MTKVRVREGGGSQLGVKFEWCHLWYNTVTIGWIINVRMLNWLGIRKTRDLGAKSLKKWILWLQLSSFWLLVMTLLLRHFHMQVKLYTIYLIQVQHIVFPASPYFYLNLRTLHSVYTSLLLANNTETQITRSVHGKFNCITVKYNGTWHGIYLIS